MCFVAESPLSKPLELCEFEQDCANSIWQFTDTPESMYSVSVALAQRHVPNLGIRTLDTLHVAAALELKADAFWTFDQRQAKLARSRWPENQLIFLKSARCDDATDAWRRGSRFRDDLLGGVARLRIQVRSSRNQRAAASWANSRIRDSTDAGMA